jgi:hypothetical protein
MEADNILRDGPAVRMTTSASHLQRLLNRLPSSSIDAGPHAAGAFAADLSDQAGALS